MARFFNTAGPCNARDHYMLPPERRLPRVPRLIDQKLYFVLHAPRQSGKTTSMEALARSLRQEGRYAVALASCEAAQVAGGDLDRGVQALLRDLSLKARDLPDELRPEPVESVSSVEPESRLAHFLAAWSERSPRPVVLFLDEIDALVDETLLSVLRQLRSQYSRRPEHFPQSVALIGLRDVNIKVESLSLANFTAGEVAELYEQHTAETGQRFTDEAKALAYELTLGQPWLVNALAREAVENLVPDPGQAITGRVIEAAKEVLLQRRDTHLDSLIDRLREPRVRRVLEPVLAGETLGADVLDDDVRFVEDLGLLTPDLTIANPIYREVVPRALTQLLELSIPPISPGYVAPDGSLSLDRLLEGFLAFWRENAESFLGKAPYSEAAAQLVFMAFLHRVVNGGGSIEREYAVGSGRIDLSVRWPRHSRRQCFAFELKIWRDGRPDPLGEGLEQLGAYLDRMGLSEGTLLLFDARKHALPLPERISQAVVEHRGRQVTVVRL